jgi:hypothetical protein
MRRRPTITSLLAAALLGATVLLGVASPPAGAGEGGDGTSGYVGGANGDNDVTGNAGWEDPGAPGEVTRTGNGQPNCTMSDGTPAYLSYKGLQWTTMDEQRTDIRPEEQRPGVYLHTYCGGEWLGFGFYPEAEPIDPYALARQVVIRPPVPVIHTSPAAGDHLVDVVAWFWLEDWGSLGDSVSAGPVTVNVYANPVSVLIDPGDNSGTFTCVQPPAYSPGADPATGCTHTYQTAGHYEATATVTYETGFTGTTPAGAVADTLDTITVTGAIDLDVREAQAIVVG